MKFSKLRLVGFKSFVEPVQLDILEGLTGIVGPNGCGKSNLLEALRWVMGETSYKSMRGAEMDDVIFAGTNTRPSHNHAEVVLTLDNQERTMPADYNDEAFVEVSRRTEREKGSSYNINGRHVRARDVQTMFADVSTGARATSLVQQGQIGDLINAKPEDRRRILEEAAGIAGLHTRRREAEIKLNHAHNNLQKLKEGFRDLATQLRALRRQARQAQQYKDLSHKLRELEAVVLYMGWEQARFSAEKAKGALQKIEEKVSALTKEATHQSRQQLEAQEALNPLREAEKLEAINMRQFQSTLEKLDKEEMHLKELQARLKQQIEICLQDKKTEGERVEESERDLRKLVAEKQMIENRPLKQSQEEEDAVRESVLWKTKALGEAESLLDKQNQTLAQSQARVQSLQNERNQLMTQKEKIANELNIHSAQHKKINTQKQNILGKSHVADGDDLPKMMEAENDAKRKLDDALDRLNRANDKVQKALLPYQKASAKTARLLGEQAILSALFATDENHSFSSLCDEVKFTKGFESVFAYVLGDALQASFDDKAPAFWRLLSNEEDELPPLPQKVLPAINFIQASKKVKHILHKSLSQIGIVERQDGARLQNKLHNGQILVSREGDVWRWDGYCARSDAKNATMRLSPQRGRFDIVNDELEKSQKGRSPAESRI